jgi:hypothetical protein
VGRIGIEAIPIRVESNQIVRLDFAVCAALRIESPHQLVRCESERLVVRQTTRRVERTTDNRSTLKGQHHGSEEKSREEKIHQKSEKEVI